MLRGAAGTDSAAGGHVDGGLLKAPEWETEAPVVRPPPHLPSDTPTAFFVLVLPFFPPRRAGGFAFRGAIAEPQPKNQ